MKTSTFAGTLALLLAMAGSRAPAQTIKLVDPSIAALQAQADELHDRAVRQARQAKTTEAVELYELSAKLRRKGDTRAFDSFKAAAQLYMTAGQLPAARYTMQKAADWAHRRGDVINESRCYVELVLIAARQSRANDVIVLAHYAQWLANSPELPSADRDAVLVRVSSPLAAARRATSRR